MSLKDITADVQAALTAAGVTGVAFDFGAESIQKLEAPPRVVWVPKGGPGGPPNGPGRSPRPLRTWSFTVEAHVWAKAADPAAASADHYAAAESLFNSLVAAIHHATHGSYVFEQAVWPEMNGDLLAYGRVVIGSFTFAIPITDTAPTTATPTAMALTQEVDP